MKKISREEQEYKNKELISRLLSIEELSNLCFSRSIVEEDRYFLYLFIDTDNLEISKLGDHYVKKGSNPWKSCLDRVRNQQGTSKHKFDRGTVRMIKIWDVTEYAKARGMDYLHSKIDKKIHPHIAPTLSGDWLEIDPEKCVIKVNNHLSKENQPLPELKLSTAQWQALMSVLTIFGNKKDRIMAELFARHGKTLFSGAVAIETGVSLTVVASYVKTVFVSFASQITSFEQFKDIVHVDTQDEDYQEKISCALSEGKQVFAYLSMCNGSKRQNRIDFLYSREVSRLTLVDEADFGSHQPKQAQALIKAIKEGDKVILLTGTNADRAVGSWGNLIQDFISCTYYEALVHKKEAKEALGLA